MSTSGSSWLTTLVASFGLDCKLKLDGPGDREAAIRTPLEKLLSGVGNEFGVTAVFHDEVRDEERRVRPDYGVKVDGSITGYIEVKAPGKSVDPESFTGHDARQWDRQKDLPNLVYTNGTEWRLYRNTHLVGEPVHFSGGSLTQAGHKLQAPAAFETLLRDFMLWGPSPITSVSTLVQEVAPLTRLLRGEVLDQLDIEKRNVAQGASEEDQPFTGLASDWRKLLFPSASDEIFADGYAQTVAFALLLAKTDNIELAGASLHDIGDRLGSHHSLMGRALQLLTERIIGDFKVTLDLLVRVIDAVDWVSVRSGKKDTYLHLYENFLALYDPQLRKKSGSYYTPREVVEQMARLAEDALISGLGKSQGFLDPDVLIVDPAMGTGTYLHQIIERCAERALNSNGPGLVPGTVGDVARRIIGFELQMGPYAVAELRTTDLLRKYGADLPAAGMRTYVTNTLDDPNADVTQLASGLSTISASRRRANEVKARTPVTVVIGNPPYRENSGGEGGWIESGDPSNDIDPPLKDFRIAGDGVYVQNMKNLYVYFWRWATWKVFDAHPSDRAGVVCFITTSGYLRGPGFKGMRTYLRKTCSMGWIIDLSPEGMQPSVASRVFPGVQQPLAIGLFVRSPEADDTVPADIWYTKVEGKRQDKFRALADLRLDGEGWRKARSEWAAPLTPAAASDWDSFPAIGDIMPWGTPGVATNRTWVWDPSVDTLDKRWRRLVSETDRQKKEKLLKKTASTTLQTVPKPLPGDDTHKASMSIEREVGGLPTPVRAAYRSFDRQWIIPDSRLMHRARADLWAARIGNQVFAVEQNSKPIKDGPGLVFTSLIPEMDYFKGSECGRVLPLLHPSGEVNLAPNLLQVLRRELGASDLAAEDLLAYCAGVVAHPAYTKGFADELTTPGVRIPITRRADLWSRAVELGRKVIWLQTYGAALVDAENGRPPGNIRYAQGDTRQPLATAAVSGMPDSIDYDSSDQVVKMGTGTWGPVPPEVWSYTVGGKSIIKTWFSYRKKNPGGKKASPLDEMHATIWPTAWTIEFIDLLTVLRRLTEMESEQAQLLSEIVGGDLVSVSQLQKNGVKFPAEATDRKPHFSIQSNSDAEALPFDDA